MFIDYHFYYRNGIWYESIKSGASTKIVRMLKTIYEKVKASVRANGLTSEYFESYMGIRQGEPLSPLLFDIFINYMYQYLYTDSYVYLNIDDIKLFLLLFADDAVLLSYTKEGLQTLLDNLERYCDKSGMTVNTEKTVVMVCQNGPP